MTSSNPTFVSSSAQNTITYIAPSDTDLASIVVLRSTSPVVDRPVEGTTYATSSTIGAATVACSYALTASSTATCTDTGLTNGTQYYYKFFTRDSTGNFSLGQDLPANPISPGVFSVTLGVGTDTPSVTVAPGGTATTSDTFTFQTSSGTDVIQNVTVAMATSTATSTSLVEITNDAGNTVYGSVANPTTDTFNVTLTGLTANTTRTQYRIRVTPKSHVNMPAVPGSMYYITSYIANWQGTSGSKVGSDLGGATTTVVTIDNVSPLAPTTVYGTTNLFDTITILYMQSTSTDATSTVVLRSTSPVTDAPTEGVTYIASNTIGASTVACATSVTPGALGSCSYSPPKGTNFYFKVFSKDVTGNYSTGVAPVDQPLIIRSFGSGALRSEIEVQTGTTTVTGGGTGGGDGQDGGDTGTTTNATTTTGGGSGGGSGGGGDVGFNYGGSNLAVKTPSLFGSFMNTLSRFLVGGAENSYAAQGSVTGTGCSLAIFGICLIK
jgi:hypothetical protein